MFELVLMIGGLLFVGGFWAWAFLYVYGYVDWKPPGLGR